jgi:hypothetical protein
MNVKTIIDQAIIHKDMTIDSVYGRRWINEAMNYLANRYDSACVQTETTIECTDILTEYDLPTGCIGVRRIFDSDGLPYRNFTVELGRIMFENTDTYTVRYLSVPSNVTTDTETPTINSNFHLPIALFVAGRELSRVNKNDTKAPQLMQEFYFEVDKVNARLSNQKRGARRISTPSWM